MHYVAPPADDMQAMLANQGKLSNVLSKEVPLRAEPGVWDAIVQAVARAFDMLEPS